MSKTMEPKRRSAADLPKDDAFEEVVKLMALASDATSRLMEMNAEVDAALLKLIDEHLPEYAKLQAALTQAESAMEIHARTHPQWFASAKTIKTPYGSISFRSGTSLEIKDGEATIRLLRALEPRLNQTLGAEKAPWIAEDYIRQTEEPNVEALEKLPEETLNLFMVKRVTKDNFAFKPATVDFGKAVKEAATKAAEKAQSVINN
jgi:hypothetical protein